MKKTLKSARKIIIMVVMIVAVAAVPAVSWGADYSLYGNNLTVSIDDSQWTVFTRDNIKNNKDLKRLGTDYKTMKNSMKNVNAYLVAVKEGKKANTELMVRASEIKYINNMNTLDADELKAVKNGVQETYSDEIDNCVTEIYKTDTCKFIKITGDYDDGEYNTIEYFTIINGVNYLFTVQKRGTITSEEKREVEEIVEGSEFKVDSELTENDIESYVAEQEKKNDESRQERSNPVTKAVGVAIVAVGIIAILKFKNRKRKR